MDGVRRAECDYRVVLRGELGDQFAVLFEPMTLVRTRGTTILTGHVGDQAQLLGLVARIQELGCEVLSVHQLGQLEDSPAPATSEPGEPADSAPAGRDDGPSSGDES